VFLIFLLIVVEKIISEVFLTFSNSKSRFNNPLQRACSAIQKAAYDSEMVPEAACGPENSSENPL
jgi:hypothetical protein